MKNFFLVYFIQFLCTKTVAERNSSKSGHLKKKKKKRLFSLFMAAKKMIKIEI